MPKVSPLRMMLMGGSPKSGQNRKCSDQEPPIEEEQSIDHKKSVPCTPRPKKSGFATVFPHSENVPENVLSPPPTDRRAKAKLSWYQRQVKNLGSAAEGQSIPRNPQQQPRIRTPHAREPLSSSSSNVDQTPRRGISRSLKYGSTTVLDTPSPTSTQTPYFELKEDSSFWLDHNVQVLIRIRPLSSDEISVQGYERCLRQESPHTLTWVGNPEVRFTFDHVACEGITQEKLFKVAGMPMIENCMRGYNSSIFAYGQTGSGKTHTVLGDIYRPQSEFRGVTPRVFEHLFLRIQMEEDSRRHDKLKYTCKCSFLEIYNEQITDLLEPSSTNLQVREDVKKGVYVEHLSEVEVNSVEDIAKLLLLGSANRKVASTNMNRESSRSHSVLTCVIESKWEREAVVNRRYGRLNLVDLAGSERQKASGVENERLKEAANINKSLSTLGLVIMILVDVANGKQRHVPYRDSKLTYLLQDSLGGNSKTMIIATVSPSISCSFDTLSTLKFGQRAKFICNNAVVNEDTSGDVNALRQQIHKLKEEVNRLRCQSSEASSSIEDEESSSIAQQRNLERKSSPTPKKNKDLGRMLSAEFRKLNQLRESLEAELEISPPLNEKNYRKLFQESQAENEILRRQIAEIQACSEEHQGDPKVLAKIEALEQEQEKQLKNISHLETLLQNSEESRVEQAAKITSLERKVNQYAAQAEELQSQLKEAKDVQEQMESQQLFLMNEFETSLDKNTQLCETLKSVEAKEQKLKDQLRLLKWELKKKQEVQDLEKELQTRVCAESMVEGYVDEEEKIVLEEKLKKTRKELEDARRRNRAFEGEEASRVAREKQMDITRAEVEAETANTIACLNRELMVAKEQSEDASRRAAEMMAELLELRSGCKALTDECSRLRAAYKLVVEERNFEVGEWETTTGKMMESFVEGDRALDAAAKEMEEILQESLAVEEDGGGGGVGKISVEVQQVEALQARLHRVLCVARDAEEKMKALSEQAKSENEVLVSESEMLKRQVREAEKMAHVAALVVRHLENKVGAAREVLDQEWRLEKEELLMELTEAKLEAAAKSRETTNVLEKFRESQGMVNEAETLLNALVRVNESAKLGAEGWKAEMRRNLPLFPEKMDARLDKARGDMAVIKQELRAFKIDGVAALGEAEEEIRKTMRSLEEGLRDIMGFVFGVRVEMSDEFLGLKGKLQEVVDEAGAFVEEIRRKNEVVKGLQYDISLLQEAFSEANEKRMELQDANESMQEELELKTNEIEGAESELLQLLKTLTTAEAELRGVRDVTTYLSSDNAALRDRVSKLEDSSEKLREELDDKNRLVETLDAELLELSSMFERRVLLTPTTGNPELDVLIKERDELHVELARLQEELRASRTFAQELEEAVSKSKMVAEEHRALAEEKCEEVRVLERSVQELECTITTLENQIGLLKREMESQRSRKEDLEMELHRLKSYNARTIPHVEDNTGESICVDKLKLLRLEEELQSSRDEVRARESKITALEKHNLELKELSEKEGRCHRKKIKQLEASFGAKLVQRPMSQAAPPPEAKAKGGSPFKCIGIGGSAAEMAQELSRSKRRLEELQARKLAQDKEVFMLNAKLAQAESMTYDVVRDLLGVKLDITGFVGQQQHL